MRKKRKKRRRKKEMKKRDSEVGVRYKPPSPSGIRNEERRGTRRTRGKKRETGRGRRERE
ncbi:hypothetical protein MGYG_09156 [Nannizzia gypsea CBS 118893]|uniref:Uncharacterized protein n=1 Tax=Arthroderma gypseum (strain ATCC MYA-4604 / CBS 118893) TaxID=535722 RepID=E4V3B0_ARTGP|nr:hypothetical protein MGYG_09156 [Nannizzia gypsea CBS 118893]EFR04484.1 hypothetical protein MGYG_09156 [Nannizzia gypsea CBS 118893]